MKKIFAILMTLFLSSCKSFSLQEEMRVSDLGMDKLPTLEAIYEDEKSFKTVANNEMTTRSNNEYSTIFYREVETNISNPYGEKKGRIILRPIFYKIDQKGVWFLTPLFTLWTANILGCPANHYESLVELEVRIVDNKGNLIKKYSAENQDDEYVAMWWSYADPVAVKASILRAYKNALRDITQQIHKDFNYLNSKLK